MKKIPTVFIKEFNGREFIEIKNEFTNDVCKNAFLNGVATVKFDGSACAIINGELYRRYDAKLDKQGNRKKVPDGAIPCQDKPDPVTGHFPVWIKCERYDPSCKHYVAAWLNSEIMEDGTYEAVGPHFRGNPHNFEHDTLIKHGSEVLDDVPRTFEGIQEYLREHVIEGIVFWFNGEPICKVKRSDFKFGWNN